MSRASSTDGRFDLDDLEAPFQGGVFFDVFPVFVHRGRADALHFPAAEGRLDDVGGVHRPFRRAGADDGVQLVNKKNDRSWRAGFHP